MSKLNPIINVSVAVNVDTLRSSEYIYVTIFRRFIISSTVDYQEYEFSNRPAMTRNLKRVRLMQDLLLKQEPNSSS